MKERPAKDSVKIKRSIEKGSPRKLGNLQQRAGRSRVRGKMEIAQPVEGLYPSTLLSGGKSG